MARRYAVASSVGVTNTDATVLFNAPISASTIRPRICDVLIGSKATPADNAAAYRWLRSTTAGTTPVTTYTPNALDPADPGSLATANAGTYGTPPTQTANSQLLTMAHNMRQPLRWIANPGFELVVPATANNGLALVGYTPTTAFSIDYTVMWEE